MAGLAGVGATALMYIGRYQHSDHCTFCQHNVYIMYM